MAGRRVRGVGRGRGGVEDSDAVIELGLGGKGFFSLPGVVPGGWGVADGARGE